MKRLLFSATLLFTLLGIAGLLYPMGVHLYRFATDPAYQERFRIGLPDYRYIGARADVEQPLPGEPGAVEPAIAAERQPLGLLSGPPKLAAQPRPLELPVGRLKAFLMGMVCSALAVLSGVLYFRK